MSEIEILSTEKRESIKKLLHCLDVGTTDFRFGCICNHQMVKNGTVTTTVTGFHGEGKTDSLAVLNLIDDVWEHLSPEEKQQVKGILE